MRSHSICRPLTLAVGLLVPIFAAHAQSAIEPQQASPAETRSATVSAPVPDTTMDTRVTHLLGTHGLPGTEPQQTTYDGNHTRLFQVVGMSGEIGAPVTDPYDSSNTYNTFAGQPGRGSTAVLAASMDGAP